MARPFHIAYIIRITKRSRFTIIGSQSSCFLEENGISSILIYIIGSIIVIVIITHRSFINNRKGWCKLSSLDSKPWATPKP